MRGGDRVVQECSWMSGIRFDFHHSTYYCRNLSFRHPSSASLAGSEVPSSLAASPRGKPRTQNLLANAIQRTTWLRELREAQLPLQGVCHCLTASQIGSAVGAANLAARVAKLATPTGLRSFWLVASTGAYSLFPIHSYFLPTPTQVGAAGRVREPTYGCRLHASLKKEKIWIQSLKQRI